MSFQIEKNVITKLRVGGNRLDAVSTRLYFERLFANTNLAPAGLPPKAIICIKHLRDPAPQTLNLERNASRFSDVWQKAVTREIEKLFRRAVRPLTELVPANAESVVFMNKAELLACLAGDWCKGNLIQNWWWRSLFPNLERAQTIARIWIEAAEFAPFALQILAGKGNAAEFINKLQTDESNDLSEQIIKAFGLSKLHNALIEPLTKEEKIQFQNVSENKRTGNLKKKPAEVFFQDNFLPEIVSDIYFENLTVEKKILVIAGILLARAPHVARSTEFARQVRQFKIETEILHKPSKQKTKTISEQTVIFEEKREKNIEIINYKREKKSRLSFSKTETETEKFAKRKIESDLNETENTEDGKKGKQKDFSGDDLNIQSAKVAKIKAKKTDFEKSKVEILTETGEGEKRSRNLPIEQLERFPDFSAGTAEETETELFDFVIHSRFGGVFYLLNLGLYLGLYRDFSSTLCDEIDMNIWDFVALLSDEFLGEDFKEDAVCNLLADLAGREDEKDFGRDFFAPDEWRVLPEWLKTFPPNKKWFWSKSEDRLIVRHSENFCVIDVASDDFENQLESELKIYAGFFSEIEEIAAEEISPKSNASQRWLKYFFEFAECRLLQALKSRIAE